MSVLDNQPFIYESLKDSENDILTINQVCNLLSVSKATVKNWVRLGKLNTEDDGNTFSRLYIENLIKEIKCGKDSRLKSRRNKKNISGKVLYSGYIENDKNYKVIEEILNNYHYISEDELRIIIAHFAIQFYEQCGGIIDCEWLKNRGAVSNNEVFNSLIKDLLKNVNLKGVDNYKIKFILDCKMKFISSEDTLGFLYISLRDLSERKQTGAYYTSANTVKMLVDNLLECCSDKIGNVFDPCCGTGNFLIGLLEKGVSVRKIFGQDIDELSVVITRINMFLLNKDLTKEYLYSHFICGDTLKNTFSEKFSVVLGNPPWGYEFSNDEVLYFSQNYITAKSKGIESYDLFVEKGLNMLEENGYLAYVLPESVLNVGSHLNVRKLILKNASFKFALYLGDVFSNVQCPSIILGLEKGKSGCTKQCKVLTENKEFIIGENRNIDVNLLSFNMDDEEYDCLCTIDNVKNPKYLKNNAKFALGIVTGNNSQWIRKKKEDDFEVILRGSDICKYSVKSMNNYIKFEPDKFQQIAKIDFYRAKEKLLYRFIADVPVFTYDNQQRLSLNSCNILIPQIEGLDIKYILAVLNSSVSAFYMNKKFNSLKILKTHIESLPIPMVDMEKQNKIVQKVDLMLEQNGESEVLYDEIDYDIMNLYGLTEVQKKIIKSALKGKKSYLK